MDCQSWEGWAWHARGRAVENCLLPTVIPPKENLLVSGWLLPLTATTAAGNGQGRCECCAGAAPGQPQEPLIVSAMKARAGILQGMAPCKAASSLSCSFCPTAAAAATSPSSTCPCLWLSVPLLPQTALLGPAFLPLSLPCPLPAPAATAASAVPCSPDVGTPSPSPAADWWDKCACPTALLLVKDADSGSSIPVRQS